MADDRSSGGSRILRHAAPTSEHELAIGDGASIERIARHIEQHLGAPDVVWHELVSDLVHVDVHHVPPRPGREFHTLVTTGMSDRPMAAPENALRHAELLLCLPPDWPLTAEAFRDERNYWPIRCLKSLARFPHEYGTWLWWGHTVPNGDPAAPFAAGTELCCALVELPRLCDPAFLSLEISPEKTVHFFSLVFLHRDEMNLKLTKGIEALEDLFDRHGVSELLDPKRPNVARRKWLGVF